LKIKIFIRQLARGCLPASEQIKKHHGPTDGRCVLCVQSEDVAHIFFNCPLAQFMWSGLHTMFHLSWNPSSFANVFGIFNVIMAKLEGFCGLCLRPRARRFGRPGTSLLWKLSFLSSQLTEFSNAFFFCRSGGCYKRLRCSTLDEMIAKLKDLYFKTVSRQEAQQAIYPSAGSMSCLSTFLLLLLDFSLRAFVVNICTSGYVL
jgi:hypothetical protein